jgi:hypothetical protein
MTWVNETSLSTGSALPPAGLFLVVGECRDPPQPQFIRDWKKAAVHPLLSTGTAHTYIGSTLFNLLLQGEALRQSESWLHGEPSIQEVMSDPIVHLVMRRDGLTPENVWAVIEAASIKLQLKPEEVAHIGGKGAGSEVMDLQGRW